MEAFTKFFGGGPKFFFEGWVQSFIFLIFMLGSKKIMRGTIIYKIHFPLFWIQIPQNSGKLGNMAIFEFSMAADTKLKCALKITSLNCIERKKIYNV